MAYFGRRLLSQSSRTGWTNPWVCARCARRQQPWVSLRSAHHSSKSHGYRPRRTVVVSAVVASALGLGGFALQDDIKHGLAAAQRTGRVMTTLAICINDYRVTLNHTYGNEQERHQALKQCHQRCADRTLQVLERNGSIFIKLGQHLSSLTYLLPTEWTTTFIPLQDKCPVSPFESIKAMVEKDTGRELAELFESFEETPLGAASLAQVHRAIWRETGQEVAVKVQHPALEEWVPLDLALTRFTFAMLKRFFPEYDLEFLSTEMESSLPQELDFAQEGRNALRAREYFRHVDEPSLVIPDVIWAQRRVLVMEYITGRRPDDIEYLDENRIDRDEVSAALARIFDEMIFGDGAPLHCDPHGGNIAIRKHPTRRRPNFDIILYDHGLYRDIPLALRRSYAKLWLAVIDADEPRMRKYAFEVAGITDEQVVDTRSYKTRIDADLREQFPLFASAITGRDYRVLTQSVTLPRSQQEKEHISDALGDGMLQELVQLLGRVPRIILLILKTNDLTRSLDENLQTSEGGPLRTFLILARYCARTVFREEVEAVWQLGGNGSGTGVDGGRNGSRGGASGTRLALRPRALLRLVAAWLALVRVEIKLSVFEWVVEAKRVLRRWGLAGP